MLTAASFIACGDDKDDPGKDDPVTYTVTFDANGGTLTGDDDSDNKVVVTVKENEKVANAPTASKDGSTFNGWYDADGMKLFVSPGTGIWNGFLTRLGVPSELTVLTLRRGGE